MAESEGSSHLGFAARVICAVTLMALPAAVLVAGEVRRDYRAHAEEFVSQLAQGDFVAAVEHFDDVMRGAMGPDKLKATWESLEKKAGPFKKTVRVRKDMQGNYHIVYVTGEFAKGPLDIKVVFSRSGEISGLWFLPASPRSYNPPAYVAAGSYREVQVTVGLPPWALPGTLTLPAGRGPFPALVLVHGSGPNDRDETVGAAKPFRDLALGLAARGIAVLRYEKRTRRYGGKIVSAGRPITVKEETIDDVIAAIECCLRRPEIDPARIFVLGHSLGGMLIPRIADRADAAAGFIVLAGTARPLEDVALEQVRYIIGLDGIVSAEEKKKLEEIEAVVARIKDPAFGQNARPGERFLGATAAYWLDLRGYNPPELARNMIRPLLVMQGGRDYQVTMRDFAAWRKELSGRANVTFKTYPRLNHLFIAGTGPSTPAEYLKAGHVDLRVVEDIADWIKRQ